ncbi:MAG: hypothetical protein GX202_02885, partial [Firmicutes bacterium]|nr:hypothetical protein [Bacillota bacterium]
MAKMRVYELSKELGIQSKDLMIILNEMGAGVKNHMSTVEEEYIEKVRASFNPEGRSSPKQKPKGTPKPAGSMVPAAKAKTEPEQKKEAAVPEKAKPKEKPAATVKPAGPTKVPKEPQPKAALPSDRPVMVKKGQEQRRDTPVKPPTAGGKPPHPKGIRPKTGVGKNVNRTISAKGKGGERSGRPVPVGGPAGGPGKPA